MYKNSLRLKLKAKLIFIVTQPFIPPTKQLYNKPFNYKTFNYKEFYCMNNDPNLGSVSGFTFCLEKHLMAFWGFYSIKYFYDTFLFLVLLVDAIKVTKIV